LRIDKQHVALVPLDGQAAAFDDRFEFRLRDRCAESVIRAGLPNHEIGIDAVEFSIQALKRAIGGLAGFPGVDDFDVRAGKSLLKRAFKPRGGAAQESPRRQAYANGRAPVARYLFDR
jgi:hypothetical protein